MPKKKTSSQKFQATLTTCVEQWGHSLNFNHEMKNYGADPLARDEFNVIIEHDSKGFFVASVPSLRGCHAQAKSLDVLMERIREAIQLCLEVKEK